ncbi:hypothetical protein [Nannocystis bainbridge]|uniref:Transposase n=1 Tax=Nannocystis bainbridge TaxID=2995303 RepID=A0ABT5E2A8_9BACT|nr:hypothetical protein [Nannocystis bainbridge]MDC0719946.1 hypothetical protein [Nannocystis bainbridge]
MASIREDTRGRRRWTTAPGRVAAIVRCLRESGEQIKDFAHAIGMPPSLLSRFDRGLRTSRDRDAGSEREWPALRRMVPPRTHYRTRGRGRREAPKAGAGEVRLRADSSIEITECRLITERRIVPYGSAEHARLLPRAVALSRAAA